MNQINRVALVLALVVLTLVPAAALAAEKTWYGRDSDGDRYRFDYAGGANWDGTFTISGKSDTVTYKEVGRTGDYIEVQIEGTTASGVRIYKNRLEFWSKSRAKWVEICKGKWTD